MSLKKLQNSLFDEPPSYEKFYPKIESIQSDGVDINIWDIPYTIKQLSYLTHDHYRYYGKFPSAVAAQILKQHPPEKAGEYVLDNFCGSGTTLVEAKLRGIDSYGLDISWISALVSNVKSNHFDIDKLNEISLTIESRRNSECYIPNDFDIGYAGKWFSESAIKDLLRIQVWLEELGGIKERDFFLVGYLAIIRRVSYAFDAEVRPHVNKEKKERDVFDAFKKKIKDMLKSQIEFQSITNNKVISNCIVGNNINLPKKFNDGLCYLAISHPPYLNSFNYRPVFSLEFFWGKPFEANYVENAHLGLIKSELVAHPANEVNTEKYFSHLVKCYKELYEAQDKNGKLAVVVGDCTRNGKLINVIGELIERISDLGYQPMEINYRTTHYGLGKYAYKERADYHGAAEKKDGIVIFKK